MADPEKDPRDPFAKMMLISGNIPADESKIGPKDFAEGGVLYPKRAAVFDAQSLKNIGAGVLLGASPTVIGTILNVATKDPRYGELAKKLLGDTPGTIGGDMVQIERNNAYAKNWVDRRIIDAKGSIYIDDLWNEHNKSLNNADRMNQAQRTYYDTCFQVGHIITLDDYYKMNPKAAKGNSELHLSETERSAAVNHGQKDAAVLVELDKNIKEYEASKEAAKKVGSVLSDSEIDGLVKEAKGDFDKFAKFHTKSGGNFTDLQTRSSYKELIEDYQLVARASVNREVQDITGGAIVFHAGDDMNFEKFKAFLRQGESPGSRKAFFDLAKNAPVAESPSVAQNQPASVVTSPDPSRLVVPAPASASNVDVKALLGKRDVAIVSALYEAKGEQSAYTALGKAVVDDLRTIYTATGEKKVLNANPNAANIGAAYDYNEFLQNHPNAGIEKHKAFAGGLTEAEYNQQVIPAAMKYAKENPMVGTGQSQSSATTPADFDKLKHDLKDEIQAYSKASDAVKAALRPTIVKHLAQVMDKNLTDSVLSVSPADAAESINKNLKTNIGKINTLNGLPAGLPDDIYKEAADLFGTGTMKFGQKITFNNSSKLSDDVLHAVNTHVAKGALSGMNLTDLEGNGGRRATDAEVYASIAKMQSPVQSTSLLEMEAAGAKKTGALPPVTPGGVSFG